MAMTMTQEASSRLVSGPTESALDKDGAAAVSSRLVSWRRCLSGEIEAFRFDPARGVIELLFSDSRLVYDFPCSAMLYQEFLLAPSKGRFVHGVLKPHAERHNWTPHPRPLGSAS
jgi:hypothetical protein